jgi:hypothetical protein
LSGQYSSYGYRTALLRQATGRSATEGSSASGKREGLKVPHKQLKTRAPWL